MRLQTISKSQFTGLDDKKFLKKKKEKKKETHIHFHIKEKKEKYLNAEVKQTLQEITGLKIYFIAGSCPT